jgi:hypothetical protein
MAGTTKERQHVRARLRAISALARVFDALCQQ